MSLRYVSIFLLRYTYVQSVENIVSLSALFIVLY